MSFEHIGDLLENMHEMRELHFPFADSSVRDIWSLYLLETLTVISELECAAHTVLGRKNDVLRYHFYIMDQDGTTCYLGTFDNTGVPIVSDLVDSVHIYKCNQTGSAKPLYCLMLFTVGLEADSETLFPWKLQLRDVDDVLSQTIYATYTLQEGEDYFLCQVRV